MAQPHYLSKYTLRDYISEIVKKEASPPPPSSRDYIRAAKKEFKVKASAQLSAEARPFQSKKSPSCISVTSLVSPTQIFQVPVYSSYLPLSTLRQYFPLATNLHYITDQQLITLAMSNNFTMIVDGVELSNQKFCIPFLETEVTYLVTEDRDLVRNEECESVMDDIVNFVRNIHVKMSDSLAEVERMEDLIIQLQSQVKKKAEEDSSWHNATTGVMNEASVDGLENVYVVEHIVKQGHESLQFMEECLVLKEDLQVDSVVADVSVSEVEEVSVEESTEAVNEVKISVNSLYDKNQNYDDDYGFSDTEDDDSDVFTSVGTVLAKTEDKHSDLFKKPASPPSPVSPQQVDTSSLSSRPRCVKRILGNC